MSHIGRLLRYLPKKAVSYYIPIRNNSKLSGETHKVNNLEKRFLVWTKKYKSVEEVPTYVAPEVVERARNRMRIRIANIMMITTLIACLLVSISGRNARDRGESVTKANLEWHRLEKEEKEKAS